jgi:NTE family protein
MKLNPLNTKIGLALGGGAAKGTAHIGVLKAFEESHIKINYLSGTSIGALVALLYSFGRSPDEIYEIAKELDYKKMINFTLKKRGFFTTDPIKKIILESIGDVKLEDGKIPLSIITTDITTGEKVVFHKGNAITAITASCSVPGAYVPIEYEDRLLVDGGIVENVPISVLESMGAGIVIGSNLNGNTLYQKPDDFFDVISNAFDMAIDLRTRDQIKEADVMINMDLSQFSRLGEPKEARKLFEQGQREAMQMINRVLWFKRGNLVRYIYKMIREILPLRVPKFLKKYFQESAEQIDL